jgi:hypothetical protein
MKLFTALVLIFSVQVSFAAWVDIEKTGISNNPADQIPPLTTFFVKQAFTKTTNETSPSASVFDLTFAPLNCWIVLGGKYNTGGKRSFAVNEMFPVNHLKVDKGNPPIIYYEMVPQRGGPGSDLMLLACASKDPSRLPTVGEVAQSFKPIMDMKVSQ